MFVQSGELITPALIPPKLHSVRHTGDQIDIDFLYRHENKTCCGYKSGID